MTAQLTNGASACNLRREEGTNTTTVLVLIAPVLIGARRQTAYTRSKSTSLRRTIDEKIGMS